jgi:hypothetical protein
LLPTGRSKAEISGTVTSPSTSTWQAIVNLIRNAFFRAILPGFDEQLRGVRP